MACLDMYNSEQHKGHGGGHHQFAPMSPRISFSNDFADAQHAIHHQRSSREAPVSSDFEFSVANHSMMSGADELFFKGRLLPFKDNCNQMQRSTTTLRDELLHGEDHDDDVASSSRPPKGSSSARWKGLLGRKRSHIGSKKAEKSDGSVDGRSGLVVHEEAQYHVNNKISQSQEVLNEGGSSWRDVDIGI